jgi:hypothetical protein
VEKDGVTPIRGKGFWASPVETVMKVLQDGRVPDRIVRERVHLVKGLFGETLRTYDGSIALLHLDCDLYQSYLTTLQTLYGKVARGGIIMFDEYADDRWPGARRAIDEFFADKPEKPAAHRKCHWKYYVRKV